MKKTALFILSISALLSPLLGETVETHCIVCGKHGWVDTSEANSQGWRYFKGGMKHEKKSGYYCTTAACVEQVSSWSSEDIAEFRSFGSYAINDAKTDEKKLAAITKMSRILAKNLIAARSEADVAGTQIKLLNMVIKQANFADFWEVFAANADMKAIQYFWPDPADENVYLSSKKHQEIVVKEETAELQALIRESHAANQSGDARKALELKKKLTILPDGSIEVGGKIRKSSKQGPGAFALGVSAKEKDVRYVETLRFSKDLLEAVIKSGRTDVLAYFIKQSGGLNDYLRPELIKRWKKANAELIHKQFMLDRQIAKAEASKKIADDKYEVKKIEDQIATLKNMKTAEKTAVSKEITALLFQNASILELAEPFSDISYIKGLAEPQIDVADAMKLISSLESGDVDGMAEAYKTDERLSGEETSQLVKKYRTEITSQFVFAAKDNAAEVSKWIQWRNDMLENWKPNVQDPWLPMMRTERDRGEWDWVRGVPFPGKPGYVTNSKIGSFLWKKGIPDKKRPGYISGEKEGTWEWKAGVPGTLGLVSGAKENSYLPAAGFVMKDGKAVWAEGTAHSSMPGLVAGKEMFTWLPDAQHLWKDEKNVNSLEVQDDHQVPNTVGKIFLLPLIIILGIR